MVDLVKTFFEHQRGGFLTAYSTRAEHGNFLTFMGEQLTVDVPWKLSKGFSLRVDGPLKSTDINLITVSSVNNYCVGVWDECIPILGLNVLADFFSGANARHAECDNLFFKPYLHPVKRVWRGDRLFMGQRFKFTIKQSVGFDVFMKGENWRVLGWEGAINPFACEQNSALNIMLITKLLNRGLQILIGGQVYKVIEGSC